MAKDYENIAEYAVLSGGVNVGLSLFNINVIKMVADATVPVISTIAVAVVGISAVYLLYKKFA